MAYGSYGISNGKVPVEKAVVQAEKFAENGFKAIKLRIQIRENNIDPNPDITLKYARAVRKAVGDDMELIIDINEGYTSARAIRVGRILQNELGVNYYEAPCPEESHKDTAAVVNALDMYVMTGEKAYDLFRQRDLILEANPDIINPDFIKSGGITEGKRIVSLARAFNKPVVAHNTKPTLGTAATMHILTSISNCGPFVEFPDVEKYATLRQAIADVPFKDGYLSVPEAPGLGLEVDETAMKKLQED